MELHLELADLGVKGEGVEEHGADESYVGRLAGGEEVFDIVGGEKRNKPPVIDPLPPVNPESGQLGEDVDHAEGLQVVDEDVGHPQAVDQLQVHCKVK